MSSSPGTVSKILWHFTGGPRWNEAEKRQEAAPKPVDDAYAALVGILSSRTLNLGSYQEVVSIAVSKLKSDGEGGYREVLSPALSTRILVLFYEAVSREVFVLSVVDGLLVGRLLRPALISE